MSNYKIIACDLDGTLLDSNSNISKENSNAIKELFKRGVFFVPATGRTISEIPKELMENLNIRYFIYSNGAGVYDKETGEHILLCMSKAVSNKVLDIVAPCDVHIAFRYNGECFADINQQTEEIYRDYTVWHNHKKIIAEFANQIENLTDYCRTLDNIEVFTLFFKNKNEWEKSKKHLTEMGDVLLMESFPEGYAFEVCSINSGKGKALLALAEKLGISQKDTVACGDGNNDCTMLTDAALALAPSNACENIKNLADKIICSNDEHIVKYISEII